MKKMTSKNKKAKNSKKRTTQKTKIIKSKKPIKTKQKSGDKINITSVSSKENSFNIIEQNIEKAIESNFMPYSMSVVVSRAIPEIDGLKPSHRKLLYTMYKMGLTPNSLRTKSANIASQTMLLNPHGDAANYETMVRLTKENETLLAPLVDGKGNFGKHYSRDMSPSASRYTEAKLLPISEEFFKGIKKDSSNMIPNYDNTTVEPKLLPVTFPNILANPNQGIAVGMASNICSFNLKELCLATIMRIEHPKKDIREVMPAPDFSTGGYILLENDVIKEIYSKGTGSLKLRAKYRINEKENIIEVYEIPYSTSSEQIIEGIISSYKSGKIKEISDVRDESDKEGFKIAIDYKRGTNPDELMKKLFFLTKLQDSFACNFNVLINGTAKTIGVYEILDNWIDWRRGCVKKELEYDLKQKQNYLHLLEGLAKVLLNIDKCIKIIRKTKEDKEVVPALMKAFKLDEVQAEYVAEIKLRNLNKDYILNKTKSIKSLKQEIAELKNTLKTGIDKVIIKTLKEVSEKYGIDRKSEIIKYKNDEIKVKIEKENFKSNIIITKNNFIKKISSDSFKLENVKIPQGDEILFNQECDEDSELLFFTTAGRVYKLLVSKLKLHKNSDNCDDATSLIKASVEEKIIFTTVLLDKKNIVICYENGKAVKLPLSTYKTISNKKVFQKGFNIKVIPISICLDDNKNIMFEATNGKKISVKTSQIPLKTTRTAQGVQVQRLSSDNLTIKAYPTTDTKYAVSSIPAAGKK